jgi:hypothetical protein
MNLSTPKTNPSYDSLSLSLHEQARRHRSRMLGAFFARLIARLSLPTAAQLPIARWG